MAGYIGSKVAVVSSGAERKKVFTATSGQTSFTGLSYTVNNVHVFQNGVRLVDGTDYTATNGNSITLTVGAATDDQVVVVSYNTFQTSDTVSASTGGTFAGDVNFTGVFTSQGIDDNATSTAMTLDASNNLLVGKTSLTLNTEGHALAPTFARFTRNGGAPVQFNRTANDGDIALFYKDGTTVGSIGTIAGDLTIGDDDIGIRFDTGSGLIPWDLGANSTGGLARDAAIDIGASSARFKDLYLSGGVYLGGTGSANHLDDYEFGFFEPTYTSNGTNPSGITYDPTVGNEGRYTKIGGLVHIQINIRTDAISNKGTGSLRISGLPFTAGSYSSQGGYATFSCSAAGFLNNQPSAAQVPEGGTYLELLYRPTSDGDVQSVATSSLNTFSNDNLIRISGTYMTEE